MCLYLQPNDTSSLCTCILKPDTLLLLLLLLLLLHLYVLYLLPDDTFSLYTCILNLILFLYALVSSNL